MPKPFKLTSTRPLPPAAEIIDRDGRPHVRIKDGRNRPIVCRVSQDGRSYLRPSKCWYFKVRDANGTVCRIKGYADLKATEQLAAEMERNVSRVRSGFTDPAEEHARRPLSEHLKDYAAHLEAKGDTSSHVKLTKRRIAALLSGCGFAFAADVDAGKASGWLNNLRRDVLPVAIPNGESFTPSETAKLLGVSGSAIRKAVERAGLEATGNGKARKLPRSTVEALLTQRARGCAPETINHYVRAVRGFFRWLVRAKRIGSNPLDLLTVVNAAVDVRRARRELTADELRHLFVAARDSERSVLGLTGRDRFHLYLAAVGTGFRANALAHLTPADFNLDPLSPCVTLPARFAKNRRTKVQPIPCDVADALRDYLGALPSNALIWGGTWVRRGADMLRRDLEAAGIAYAVKGPDGPEYADFHALRHSYLTLGGRSGINSRTLQELAGHSSPTLTARYSHRNFQDLAAAVGMLPNLVPTAGPDVNEMRLSKTMTEEVKSDCLVRLGVPPGVPTGCADPHLSAPISIARAETRDATICRKSLKRQGPALFRTGPHRPAQVKALGLEPRTYGLKVRLYHILTHCLIRTLRRTPISGAVPGAVSNKAKAVMSTKD